MSKVNTYIWDGKNNNVVKVTQLSFKIEPIEFDDSFMESFGIPLKNAIWSEMSYWIYCKPTDWFNKLEPLDDSKEYMEDGYDLEEVGDEDDI